MPSQGYIKEQAVSNSEADHGNNASPQPNLPQRIACEDGLRIHVVVPNDPFLLRELIVHNCFIGVLEYGQVVEPYPVLRNSRPAQFRRAMPHFRPQMVPTAFKLCNSLAIQTSIPGQLLWRIHSLTKVKETPNHSSTFKTSDVMWLCP